MTSEQRYKDPRFGDILVTSTLASGRTEVSGPDIPTVVVRRGFATAPDADLPPGAAKSATATLRVDGRTVPLRTGPGTGSKRSHRVWTEYEGVVLRLHPVDNDSSSLLRSRRLLGSPVRVRRRLATFVLRPGGPLPDGIRRYLCRWGRRSTGTAPQAALGYALAAAFGVGRYQGDREWQDAGDLADLALDTADLAGSAWTVGSAVTGAFRAVGRVVRALFD